MSIQSRIRELLARNAGPAVGRAQVPQQPEDTVFLPPVQPRYRSSLHDDFRARNRNVGPRGRSARTAVGL